jgi:prophage antirepressor-like protein
MSDTLIKGVIRKATRTEWTRFSSVIITGVSTPDGEWVLYRPIADVVGQDEARMSLFNKIVPIQYEVNGNGMWLTGDFISKAAFYGCAMISERPELREFRDAVVKVIEQLASKGFSVPPNKSDSPLMRLAKENVQIVFEVEELQRRQAAVESEQIAMRKEQEAIKQEQETIKRKQETQQQLLDHNKATRIVVVWLEEHGIDVPAKKEANGQPANCNTGMEFRSIALELGYNPDEYPKEVHGSWPTRKWPLPVLDRVGPIWIKRTRANRYDRRSWFLRYYDVYITSEKWKAFSLDCVQKAKGRCHMCNEIGRLNTHHRSYENLGSETRDDVFVVCVPCHELYTRNGRIKSYRDWIA